MNTPHVLRNSLALVVFGVIGLGSGPGLALDLSYLKQEKNVCYKRTDVDRTYILRLSIKKHSRLTTLKEKRAHNHPIQTTYSVHGKAVIAQFIDGGLVFQPVYGTMTVDDSAVQMAIVRVGLIAPSAGPTGPRSLVDHLDCQANEASATPSRMSCAGLAIIPGQVPEEFFVNSFERIDNPVEDPACSFSGIQE